MAPMEILYVAKPNRHNNYKVTLYLLQFLDGISTTNEVHFYSVPDLESLVQGREVGERCSIELVQRKTSDPNFVGNFSLTFTLPGTLVCLSLLFYIASLYSRKLQTVVLVSIKFNDSCSYAV